MTTADAPAMVSVRQWLISAEDIRAYVEVRNKFITHKPAALLGAIPGLVRPDFLIEMEVVAAVPAGQSQGGPVTSRDGGDDSAVPAVEPFAQQEHRVQPTAGSQAATQRLRLNDQEFGRKVHRTAKPSAQQDTYVRYIRLVRFSFLILMSRPVQGGGGEPAGERFAKWSWTPGPPDVQLKVTDSV